MTDENNKLLNYKYEIFPTSPQRRQLGKILKHSKIQWNKAVTIRKKLKSALISGQIEYVLNTCLSLEKKNWQAERNRAIKKFQAQNSEFSALDFENAARLYDLANIVGKVLKVESKHLDLDILAEELTEKFESELAEWKKAKQSGEKKLPKRAVFWQLMRAINHHAGFAAKQYMDKSFKSPDNMALSTIRFNISGSANSVRWNQAVSPKKGQRKYGATGEPQYKRREEGFAFPIPKSDQGKFGKIIRKKSNKSGYQIYLNALPDGMRWIDLAYHREIPKGSKIKQLTINNKAGRFFAVFSLEVPASTWMIASAQAGWRAGIDPGAATALTVALKNSVNGELRHWAINYQILEKGLEKLEAMQQKLSRMNGPSRKRTEAEIEEALNEYKSKRSFLKLPVEQQEKELARKRKKLETLHVKQESSKRWRRWSKRVSAMQLNFANQRSDILHKISRALAEGCDLIGIGNWEPEKEVSYRKKLRAAQKKVKQGIAGAAQELETIKLEKSKQGPKGAKKKRRGARDRSIATLRRLVKEKADRASISARTEVNEAGSTYTCSVCGKDTGPHGDLSIREWRCKECNTLHKRDLNSGFNILKKTENELGFGAAQAPARVRETEPESIAARTMTQGATAQPGGNSGFRATESIGRGSSFLVKHADSSFSAFGDAIPKALKSLQDMGIAHIEAVGKIAPG